LFSSSRDVLVRCAPPASSDPFTNPESTTMNDLDISQLTPEQREKLLADHAIRELQAQIVAKDAAERAARTLDQVRAEHDAVKLDFDAAVAKLRPPLDAAESALAKAEAELKDANATLYAANAALAAAEARSKD
jgi:hypothetical protein